jgi:hypothetical protein
LLDQILRRPATGHSGGRRSLAVALALWTAGAWVLPWALTALHLGAAAPVLLLLGVAASLRVGGGLLDRLVVAALLTVGAVLLLGLALSVWPWGLSGPLSCSILLTLAGCRLWVAGRLPRLPLRVRGSDLLVVGTFAVMLWQLQRPLAGLSPTQQLRFSAVSADAYVHFGIMDAIQRIPGYLFLHAATAGHYVVPPTPTSYPQGSHFFLAWLDLLVRGGKPDPVALTAYTTFFHSTLVVLALIPAVVVWGARWVAGPRLRGWRCAALLGGISGLMLVSPLVTLVPAGYDSEIFGLLCLPPTVALLVRPAMGPLEQAAMIVAGTTAVAYSYNVYAVVALVAVAALVVVHRRALRPVALWWFPLVVVGLALAALPSLYSVLTSLNLTSQAAQAGTGSATAPSLLFTGGVLAVVLLALARGVREGTAVAWSGLLVALASTAVLAAFGIWQLTTVHALSYYYDKLATAVVLVALVLGGSVGWLRVPARAASVRHRTRRLRETVVATAAAAGVFLLAANVSWAPRAEKQSTAEPVGKSAGSASASIPLVAWTRGDLALPTPPAGAFVDSPVAMATRGPVIVLDQNIGWANELDTFLANAFLRQQPVMGAWTLDVYYVGIGLGKPTREQYDDSVWDLEKALRAQGRATTIWVAEPTLVRRLQRDLTRLVPEVPVTVRLLPPTPWKPYPLGNS